MQQDSLEDISKHDKVQDVSPELGLAPRAVPDPAPARDIHGNLKDAEEMEWAYSESEDVVGKLCTPPPEKASIPDPSHPVLSDASTPTSTPQNEVIDSTVQHSGIAPKRKASNDGDAPLDLKRVKFHISQPSQSVSAVRLCPGKPHGAKGYRAPESSESDDDLEGEETGEEMDEYEEEETDENEAEEMEEYEREAIPENTMKRSVGNSRLSKNNHGHSRHHGLHANADNEVVGYSDSSQHAGKTSGKTSHPKKCQVCGTSLAKNSHEAEHVKTTNKHGPLTKVELQQLQDLERLHQAKYAEVAAAMKRPVKTILAHITGGHKSSRQRNPHNAKQQIQHILANYGGEPTEELKQAEALLEKYEQLDADDDNDLQLKVGLDKQLLGLAEALEFELCQTYAREGNVYKMMDKLRDTL